MIEDRQNCTTPLGWDLAWDKKYNLLGTIPNHFGFIPTSYHPWTPTNLLFGYLFFCTNKKIILKHEYSYFFSLSKSSYRIPYIPNDGGAVQFCQDICWEEIGKGKDSVKIDELDLTLKLCNFAQDMLKKGVSTFWMRWAHWNQQLFWFVKIVPFFKKKK